MSFEDLLEHATGLLVAIRHPLAARLVELDVEVVGMGLEKGHEDSLGAPVAAAAQQLVHEPELGLGDVGDFLERAPLEIYRCADGDLVATGQLQRIDLRARLVGHSDQGNGGQRQGQRG